MQGILGLLQQLEQVPNMNGKKRDLNNEKYVYATISNELTTYSDKVMTTKNQEKLEKQYQTDT